ncbi:LacI family DNA-binding transcriptional regulator [Bifidobacterium sp. MA2]|uniref:LacI family DNA-binding transcriptional regulator n=1 Tax=Bifidobacterium santillanense TaxID=2809028 RepID=A0ABS5UPG0_9BIFI|nr:LacI family DNA-binding transcriptional regulator [Bifidobacterium santillanense]MBT1172775.1 LacI family DNA-binding transcriptional regulator [Bifidobacterium santillanense]
MNAKAPTLKDIAEEVGVTPMTVSKALRGMPGVKASTRAKVLAVAERLNYRVNVQASSLKSGRSGIIRIMVNEYRLPFYAQLIDALSDEVRRNGLTPFLQKTGYSAESAAEAMRSPYFSGSMFDGTIAHASGVTEAGILKSGNPTVLLDDCAANPAVSTVNWPNEMGARAGVQHLIDRGCRNIGIVTVCPYMDVEDLLRDHVSNDPVRLRGARSALIDNGLPYDPEHVIRVTGLNEPQGIDAAHRLADTHAGFDGYLCMNDSLALGLIRGFADRGVRVPDDVRVIGFDGIVAGAYSVPTLSTVSVDLDQLAQIAVGQLLRQINDPDGDWRPTATTVGFALIARESTR